MSIDEIKAIQAEADMIVSGYAFREMIAGKARWDEQMRNNNIVRNMQ